MAAEKPSNGGGGEKPLITDAKRSEVKESVSLDSAASFPTVEPAAVRQKYQSILIKMCNLTAEVHRPEVDKAAVTAMASDLKHSLYDALFAADESYVNVRAIKSQKSKLIALISDFEKLEATIPLLELRIAGLERLKSSVSDLEHSIALHEKVPTRIVDLEASIADLEKVDVEILDVNRRIDALEELTFMIPELDAKIAGLENQEVAIRLLESKISSLEIRADKFPDLEAKITALMEKLAARRDEATQNQAKIGSLAIGKRH